MKIIPATTPATVARMRATFAVRRSLRLPSTRLRFRIIAPLSSLGDLADAPQGDLDRALHRRAEADPRAGVRRLAADHQRAPDRSAERAQRLKHRRQTHRVRVRADSRADGV